MVELQKSKEYENELANAGADAFQLGFMECKKQIQRLMLEMDLSSIQPDKELDESGDEDAEAKAGHPRLSSWTSLVLPSFFCICNKFFENEMKSFFMNCPTSFVCVYFFLEVGK